MEAKPDLPVARFVPDPELVAEAHNTMLANESRGHRLLRQRWEETYAAVRVGLEALREVYPSECYQLDHHLAACAEEALDNLTRAFVALDDMSDAMLGVLMTAVIRGMVTTREEYDELAEDDRDQA